MDNAEAKKHFSEFTWYLMHLYDKWPWVGVLIVLMLLDIATGIFAAFITKQISSNLSWKGMNKKVFVFLLIGMGAVIEPGTGGIPLAKAIAGFYVLTHSISILENAAVAGIPLPPVLRESLLKWKEFTKEKDSTSLHPVAVKIDRLEIHGDAQQVTLTDSQVVPAVKKPDSWKAE